MSDSGYLRGEDPRVLLGREWLVTNGIGGYASGTLSGAVTRRFHGLLVAALPAPLGRVMMLNHLDEAVVLTNGEQVLVSLGEGTRSPRGLPALSEVRMELGLPVWRYEIDGVVLERRVFLAHQQNTTYVRYRVISSPRGPIQLLLRPSVHFRSHEGSLETPLGHYVVKASGRRWDICGDDRFPALHLRPEGRAELVLDGGRTTTVECDVERARGYDYRGALHNPGFLRFELDVGEGAALVASTEAWETIEALNADEALDAELARRTRLLRAAPRELRHGSLGELVLSADQFVIAPQTRPADAARAHARGDEARTIIAGYHWFTDWGRDTMIALEGLTLLTGRASEAGCILRTFAHHLQGGLIPNFFPEGQHQGLYHTADATLWFVHALARYLEVTRDLETRRALMPTLREIVERHVHGTRFNIGVDPADGLLRQGEAGYQLTWMDAKVDDWVVTPRRGKAVEINALFYNALRWISDWARQDGDLELSGWCTNLADRVHRSFNERFWCAETGCLFDVVDGPDGDDSAIRPNQIFALSLDHPVLESSRWAPVLDTVTRELLTPVGLRSLSPGHPDYRARYDGDLRARDAAYHQGTVWGWLVGPYVDASLRVRPHDTRGAARVLEGVSAHAREGCLGTIAEIFDGDAPFHPRGCVAQAWSVAEAIRALYKLTSSRAEAEAPPRVVNDSV